MFNVEAYVKNELKCSDYEAKVAISIITFKGLTVDFSSKKENGIVLKGTDGCIAELSKDNVGNLFFASHEKNDKVEKETTIFLRGDLMANSMRSTITTESDRKEVFGSNPRGNVEVYNTESLEMIENLLASGKSMDDVSKIVAPDEVHQLIHLVDSSDAATKYFHVVKQFDRIVSEQEKSLTETKHL